MKKIHHIKIDVEVNNEIAMEYGVSTILYYYIDLILFL